MSDLVRRARRYWWHGGGVVCIIFLLLLANRFGAYVPDAGDGEQANSPVDLTHRCSFNAPCKSFKGQKLTEAEYESLYNAWVYPVKREHEQKLPFLKPIEVYGNTNAWLCVKAFYPFHRGHEHFKDYFRELGKRYYPNLRVVCINFGTPTGFELFRKHGLSCGTVILQGYPKAQVKVGEIELPVVFEGPMGEAWKKEDLEQLIERLISGHK
jgi:hypothetical protein